MKKSSTVNKKSQYTLGKKNLDQTEKCLRYELVLNTRQP